MDCLNTTVKLLAAVFQFSDDLPVKSWTEFDAHMAEMSNPVEYLCRQVQTTQQEIRPASLIADQVVHKYSQLFSISSQRAPVCSDSKFLTLPHLESRPPEPPLSRLHNP